MNVNLIFRSKLLRCHSIERVFELVSRSLESKINITNYYVEKTGFSLSNYFDILKYTRSQKSETIYHVTGDVHYAVFGIPRKRCILTIHDCVFLHRRKGLRRWLIKKIYLDLPVLYTSYITTISNKTKEEIISLTKCNPEKIIVIRNPVAPEIFLSSKTFDSTNPVILFVGSTSNKNLDRVIEALKNISCTLNIVGNPTLKQQQKLREYNINLILERNLSNLEMAQRYDSADIVLFPSLYEGFGLPVIEGFKAGKSVITSKISPMKDLAGDAGWLVDPYSSESIRSTILEVINQSDKRNEKIKSGIYLAENYSFEEVALQYQSLYNNVSKKCVV